MKSLLSILLLMMVLSTSVAQKVINDPNVQQRQVESFNAVSVGSAIDLVLTQGNEESVAVSAKTVEYRDRIKTEVKNGTLRIFYEDDKFWKNSGNKQLKAYVSVKNITKIGASGASEVQIDGVIKSEKLALDLSGASELRGEIDATDLDVDLSGASDLNVSGKVVNLTIDASGASDFKGFDLQSDNCTLDASGASNIKVTVNKELKADASGASDIDYKGEGVIRNVHTSGSSTISRKS